MGPGTEASDQRRIDLVLDKVDRLPTLSPVAVRLLSLGSADEIDLNEVTRMLESDPGLTTMILRLCRRADLGMSGRITTVKRAVVMLGIEAVRSAVLSVTVYELLRDESEESDRLGKSTDGGAEPIDRTGLWKHAVAVACCAELLAQRHPDLGVQPDEAFVAGLLHDLGRLVLDLVLPKALARVGSLAELRGSDTAPIERQIIGLDHFTVGRRIAKRWALPAALREVIWRHGQALWMLPEEPHRPLIGLITLSKAFCRERHLGWSGDFGEPGDAAEMAPMLGLPADACEAVYPELASAVVERCAVLGLDEQTEFDLLAQSVAAANRRLGQLVSRLDRQTRANAPRVRALESIADLTLSAAESSGLHGALRRIASSMREHLGPGWLALAARERSGASWLALRVGDAGVAEEATLGDIDSDADVRLKIGDHGRRGGRHAHAAGHAGWVADLLHAVGAPEGAGIVPLATPDRTNDPAVLLIHTHAEHELWGDPAVVGGLMGVWGALVRAGAAVDRADHAAEAEAEMSRALSETQGARTERESLAKLGEVTGGAAHEMNTPLAVIQGRAEMLRDGLADGTPEHANAASIAEAAAELSGMVAALHDLSAPLEPSLSAVSVDVLAGLAIEKVRSLRGASFATVDYRSEPGAMVEADRELVVRALTELLVNAAEAAPGAVVSVRAQVDGMDGRVLIRIEDRGPGFSARASRHGFAPFFSEKAAGRSRGFGLARARRLIELHDGTVVLGSAASGGGSVTVTLPLASAGRGRVRAAG